RRLHWRTSRRHPRSLTRTPHYGRSGCRERKLPPCRRAWPRSRRGGRFPFFLLVPPRGGMKNLSEVRGPKSEVTDCGFPSSDIGLRTLDFHLQTTKFPVVHRETVDWSAPRW